MIKKTLHRKEKKNRQYNGQNIDDTKGVIRSHQSKKDRQHNDQKNKQLSTKHTDKTKDRVT